MRILKFELASAANASGPLPFPFIIAEPRGPWDVDL